MDATAAMIIPEFEEKQNSGHCIVDLNCQEGAVRYMVTKKQNREENAFVKNKSYLKVLKEPTPQFHMEDISLKLS